MVLKNENLAEANYGPLGVLPRNNRIQKRESEPLLLMLAPALNSTVCGARERGRELSRWAGTRGGQVRIKLATFNLDVDPNLIAANLAHSYSDPPVGPMLARCPTRGLAGRFDSRRWPSPSKL